MKPEDLLAELLHCSPVEIDTFKDGVYKWRGIVYELVPKARITAPDSHYTKFKVNDEWWAIREVGKKSKLLQSPTITN